MSAIGSYAVVTRDRFAGCLEAARGVRQESRGKWIFQTTQTKGAADFDARWNAAVVITEPFEYSGYVLGNYLDAQYAINGLRLFDEESEPALALANVFASAFIFETRRTLPELPEDRLLEFAHEEYGENGQDLLEPIRAAHTFYARGMAEITPERLVVFLIR